MCWRFLTMEHIPPPPLHSSLKITFFSGVKYAYLPIRIGETFHLMHISCDAWVVFISQMFLHRFRNRCRLEFIFASTCKGSYGKSVYAEPTTGHCGLMIKRQNPCITKAERAEVVPFKSHVVSVRCLPHG